MNENLKLILSLSLSGSILALIIFTLKPLIKNRVSKSIQYCLWIIVILRLVIPFSPQDTLMNNIFYGKQTAASEGSYKTHSLEKENNYIPIEPAASSVSQEEAPDGENNMDINLVGKFGDIFNRYGIYLWLFGAAAAFTVNIVSYLRFVKYIKGANKPAGEQERRMIFELLEGRENVEVRRNTLAATPMLIGVMRPCIIIPDCDFSEGQLKNILLHEITHLRRFDIGVKWLALAATSLHWFNPLVYIVRREMNRACELACDEAVIKKFNSAEKQLYGDTLISVVAEHRYPVQVLQATMCEEKESLKERLVAIMNHSKKSKGTIFISIILAAVLAAGGIYLGAGVGRAEGSSNSSVEVEGYDLDKISKHHTFFIGDNGSVGKLVGLLPVPDQYYVQQYISIKTKERPYRLNVFYEPKKDGEGERPTIGPGNKNYINMQLNALVLFSMIDNADEVSFSFRDTKSQGSLQESEYDTSFTFLRKEIEMIYGSPYELGRDISKLKAVLRGEVKDIKNTDTSSGKYEAIDKLPVEYNSQLALRNGDVVYSYGSVYNSEKLVTFYNNFKGGKEGMVRITQYTDEGDAIIMDLIMDSSGARLIFDGTRNRKVTGGKTEYGIEGIIKDTDNDGRTSYTIKAQNGMGLFTFYVD